MFIQPDSVYGPSTQPASGSSSSETQPVPKRQPPHLPPELWLRILRDATQPEGSYRMLTNMYVPFEDTTLAAREPESHRQARLTQHAVIRVCSQWYNLGIEFLYENIRVCHAMSSLLAGLRRSREEWDNTHSGRPIGEWVKRIEVSVRRNTSVGRSWKTSISGSDSDESDESDISDVSVFSMVATTTPIRKVLHQILNYTPNLLVLAKSDTDLISHQLDHSNLQNLRRFDWQHTMMLRGFKPGGDDPSWGFDLLQTVLRSAPRLEWLSLGRRFKGEPLISNEHDFGSGLTEPIILDRLKTLRVSNASAATRLFIQTWHMPNLEHLVMDDSLLSFDSMRINFLPRIVEIPDPDFRPFRLGMRKVLQAFGSDVEEVGYAVAYLHQQEQPEETTTTIVGSLQYEMLHTVRLHAPAGLVPGDRVGAFKRAFEMLGGGPLVSANSTKHPSFPSLRRIFLHGPWDPLKRHGAWDAVVRDKRLRPYLDRLVNERGVRLLWGDGSEVRLRVWLDNWKPGGSESSDDGGTTP